MKRLLFTALTGLVVGIFAMPQTAEAQFQYQRPYNPRPAVSPYLNMFSGGNPAVNYYGIVRPQRETRQSLQMIQQRLQQMTPALPQAPAGADPLNIMPSTGHPVQFGNTAQYFPLRAAQPGGGGGGVGAMPGGMTGVPSTTGILRR